MFASHGTALRWAGASSAIEDQPDAETPIGLPSRSLLQQDEGLRRLVVWGPASSAPVAVPADLSGADARVHQVGVAFFSFVALRSNGSLAAFGNTSLLGPESAWRSLTNVQRLAVGYQHVLVQLRDQTLTGFGHPDHAAAFTIPAAVNAALSSRQQRLLDFAAGRNISSVLLGPPDSSASAAQASNYSLWTMGNVEAVPQDVQQAVAAAGATQVTACGPPAGGDPAFMVLLHNGTVLAWGDNRWFQAGIPTQVQSGAKAIAGGDDFSVAIRENGTVVSWGWGRVDIPDGLADAVDVVARGEEALVLTRQGRVVHLGPDEYGLSQVPQDAQSGVVAMSIGAQAAAAITTKPPAPPSPPSPAPAPPPAPPPWPEGVRRVIAWGNDAGFGTSKVPAGLAGREANVTQVAITAYTAMALLANGTVQVWGGAQTLGPPARWAALRGVRRVSGGLQHVLVLLDNGTLTGFGADTNTTRLAFTIPSALSSALTSGQQRVTTFAAGFDASLVVTAPAAGSSSVPARGSYTLWFWGAPLHSPTNRVREAITEHGALKLSVGGFGAAALLGNGTVLLWSGGSAPTDLAVPAAAQRDVEDVATGLSHTLALLRGGKVVAWGGANDRGQLSVPRNLPLAKAVRCGAFHSMILTRDGAVRVWGDSRTGVDQVPYEAQQGVSDMVANAGLTIAIASRPPSPPPAPSPSPSPPPPTLVVLPPPQASPSDGSSVRDLPAAAGPTPGAPSPPSSGGGSSQATVIGVAVGVSAGALLLLLVGGLLYVQRRRRRAVTRGTGGDESSSSTPVAVIKALGTSPKAPSRKLHIEGLVAEDLFVRMVAPHFSWWTGEADHACVPVEEGVNAHLLDLRLGPDAKAPASSASPQPSQALTSPRTSQTLSPAPSGVPPSTSDPSTRSEGSPQSPVVELSSAEVAQQLDLLPNGLMGRGATALVFKCRWPSRFGAHAVLAAKVLRDPFDAPDAEATQAFAFEANILRGLRHPNVVRLYGYCLQPPTVVIIMELLPCSLKQRLVWHRQAMFGPGRPLAPASSADASDARRSAPGGVAESGGFGVQNDATTTAAAGGAPPSSAGAPTGTTLPSPSTSTSYGAGLVSSVAGRVCGNASTTTTSGATLSEASACASLKWREGDESERTSARGLPPSSTIKLKGEGSAAPPSPYTALLVDPDERSSGTAQHSELADATERLPRSSSGAVGLSSMPSVESNRLSGSRTPLSPLVEQALSKQALKLQPSTSSRASGGALRPAGGSGFALELGLVEVLRIGRDVAAGLAFLHEQRLREDILLGCEGASGFRRVSPPSRIDEQQADDAGGRAGSDVLSTVPSAVATIVHRDLKPDNILLNSRGVAKLSDFGLARLQDAKTLHTARVAVGTLSYMAPELLDPKPGAKVTNSIDVYSLGFLLWEMVAGQTPWRGLEEGQIVAQVLRKRRPPMTLEGAEQRTGGSVLPEQLSVALSPVPLTVEAATRFEASPRLRTLIASCWQQDASRRPNAQAVYKMLQLLLRQEKQRLSTDPSST